MTVRAIKVKGEQLSFLAHADSAEQLVTGATTGETPTGWNYKVKGTYVYWVDDDGDERRKQGTLTGESRTAGEITVHGEDLYFGDDDGNERYVGAAITVEVRLSNGLDDVYVRRSISSGVERFYDDETVRFGNSGSYIFRSAVRFLNVTVPQGATITAAYITLKEYGETGTVCRFKISGEDADDAVSPTDVSEFDALVETTEKVDWDNDPAQDWSSQNTPSIVAIIQEIVDRGSWASGNAIQIIIKDDGSDSGAEREYEDYDSEPDEAALLHIEYS